MLQSTSVYSRLHQNDDFNASLENLISQPLDDDPQLVWIAPKRLCSPSLYWLVNCLVICLSLSILLYSVTKSSTDKKCAAQLSTYCMCQLVEFAVDVGHSPPVTS